ncbi:MAG TPA: SRPBCC family protein [Verrucomicrobiae bacterium]|nr:SRPBCC family protein [Verrucomicrobiae bacterium]
MANKYGNGYAGRSPDEQLARAMGWVSLGLGLASLLAPRRVGKGVGVGEHSTLLRLLGLRELVSGVGILTQARPSPWLWGRVGGDLMDIALLGAALASKDSRATRIALAGAAVAGITALDLKASRGISRNPGANLRAFHYTRTITIEKSQEELFRFWRNFENLPQIMSHVKSVQVQNDKRSHWVVKGPAGRSIEWDAEIVNERPNELIAWQSCSNADVQNAGSVRFSPATGGRGTVIKVELKYEPPAGALGATVARMFGQNPEKQIAIDLLRFKQLMETGEIARTIGQTSGRAKGAPGKLDRVLQA